MKAKEFCLQHYPNARVLKVKAKGRFTGVNFYNIYPSIDDKMWLVSGETTESKAWTALKREILDREDYDKS